MLCEQQASAASGVLGSGLADSCWAPFSEQHGFGGVVSSLGLGVRSSVSDSMSRPAVSAVATAMIGRARAKTGPKSAQVSGMDSSPV